MRTCVCNCHGSALVSCSGAIDAQSSRNEPRRCFYDFRTQIQILLRNTEHSRESQNGSHHLFESILAAYVTMNASRAHCISKTHFVVMINGAFASGSASVSAASKSAAVATLLNLWSAICKQPPASVGNFLYFSLELSPHAPVFFCPAIIGSLHDDRVPDLRQLPHLEHAAEIVTATWHHFGLEPLCSVSKGVKLPEAAAISRAPTRCTVVICRPFHWEFTDVAQC